MTLAISKIKEFKINIIKPHRVYFLENKYLNENCQISSFVVF